MAQRTIRKTDGSTMTHGYNFIGEEIIYKDQEPVWGANYFGTFFIRPTVPTRTFKFNPSQRLRAILGWSLKYKGKGYEIQFQCYI